MKMLDRYDTAGNLAYSDGYAAALRNCAQRLGSVAGARHLDADGLRTLAASERAICIEQANRRFRYWREVLGEGDE